MITQMTGKENSWHVHREKFPLQEIINDLQNIFFRVGSVIQVPCTGKRFVMGQAGHLRSGRRTRRRLVKDGFYTRYLTHVYIKTYENGRKMCYFYTEKVKIQRVLSSSGHCHALLLDFIIPYEPFTYAAALAILHLYGKSGMDPDVFCDAGLPGGVELSVKQLLNLIEWSEKNFGIIGVSLVPEENGPDTKRQALVRAVEEIRKNFKKIFMSSIAALKRTLFQRRLPVHSPHMTGQPVWQTG